MKIYSKLVMALTMCVAATNIAMAVDITPAGGTFRVISAGTGEDGKKFAFDIAAGSASDGAVFQIYDANETTQKFTFIYEGEGYYRIKPSYCDKYIDLKHTATQAVTNGTKCQIYSYSYGTTDKNANAEDQLFKPEKNDDGTYRFETKHKTSGGKVLVLDVTNGTFKNSQEIQVYEWNGSAAQRWIIEDGGSVGDTFISDAANRFYRIPAGTNMRLMELTTPSHYSLGLFRLKCFLNQGYNLEIPGNSSDANQSIRIWASGHEFEIVHEKDGYYTIRRNGQCVTIQNDVCAEHQDIITYPYNGKDNQLWKFIKHSDGSYTIVSKKDNSWALDVNNGTMENGTNVQLWHTLNNNAQKWILSPVDQDSEGRYLGRQPNIPVVDKFFTRYLIQNGYAYEYDEITHQIGNKATLANNFDGTKAKTNNFYKHVVVLSDTVKQFSALGKYGNYSHTVNGDVHAYNFDGVKDFTGMEYFTALKRLDLSRAQMGDSTQYLSSKFSYGFPKIDNNELDLTYNTELEYLDLNYANFDDISDDKNKSLKGLTKLKYLNLCNNYFRYFDMTPYEQLERLQMSHNVDLMGINANRNDNLYELAIFDSMYGWDTNYSLQSLVDKFKNLVFLHAFSTFTSGELDLHNHTRLQSVWLHNSEWSGRQFAKGNWLHKLDLSGCTELRDLHVHNMQLNSLTIPSTQLGAPLSDKYKDLQFCREVTAEGGKILGKPLVPGVEVQNNYRQVMADLAVWQLDEKVQKYNYMYYVRLTNTDDYDTGALLANKEGNYTIWSYDTYTNDSEKDSKATKSQKNIVLDKTLGNDGFDGSKVSSAKTASSENTLASKGLMKHSEGSQELCILRDKEFSNPSLIDQTFYNSVKDKINVHGSIIILKAGVVSSTSDIHSSSSPAAPRNICYTYDICDNISRAANNQVFYLDLDYIGGGIVTGIDEYLIDANKEVASVKYFNPSGIESVIPFSGINIVVTTYTDGTKSTAKVLK